MPTLKDHSIFIPRSRLAELLTRKQGTLCAIFDTNGDCYKGEWKNGKKHGIGEIKTISGYFYLGQWDNNKKQGYGILKKLNMKIKKYVLEYEGEWKNDLKHGQGVGFLSDGSFYEGDYKFGLRNGYGSMMFTDGSYYNGEWISDKMDGVGVWTNPNGNFYEGEFSQGMKHGRGMYVMPEKSSILRGVWKEDIYFSGESIQYNQTGSNEPRKTSEQMTETQVISIDCSTSTDQL